MTANTASGESKRILLAEDDAAVRRYLEVVLARAGYSVIAVEDGLAALKAVLTEPVDVLVTDALMPNLNGYELTRAVRGNPQLKELPIVLLSALETGTENTAEGANVQMLKTPNFQDDLLAVIARLLTVRN